MPFVPDFLKRIEFSVLLAGIMIAGGLFGFVELMDIAREPNRTTSTRASCLPSGRPGEPDIRSARSGWKRRCAT